MSTIDNKTITQTVTLGTVDSYPTYASPLTIGAAGVISASGNAIAAPLPAGIIFNYGNIIAGGSGASLAGGYVRNGGTSNSSATISAGSDGLQFTSTGTVVNYGTIRGAAKGVDGALNNGRLTVNNFGTIQGTATIGGTGVYLSVGGIVTNQSAGVVTGYSVGVRLRAGGTIINTGAIAGNFDGVKISGAGAAVVNSGTIFGGGAHYNHAAIVVYGSAPRVTNVVGGVIDGGGAGVALIDGGTVDNAGTIIGETSYFAIDLFAGGYVLNRAGGRIVDAAGIGVRALDASTTIVNSGFIFGGGTASYAGGFFFQGGTGIVSNQSLGSIEGYANGVIGITGGTLTLSNAGTDPCHGDGIDRRINSVWRHDKQ